LETTLARDYEELDHSKTGLLKPDSVDGWLSPEGRFFGCDYYRHDAVAQLILKQTVTDLERQGWLRVTGYWIVSGRCATAPQRNWASRFGYEIDEGL
jgi:hypothetical protein